MMTILKGIRDAYADIRWEFIRDYELADPAFSEFMSRMNEHESKYSDEFFGMSPELIRELESESDLEYRLSAEDAWIWVHENLMVEHYLLLYGKHKLRERSEAAWRKNLFRVIGSRCREVLTRPFSITPRKSRSAGT
jgi:hypothetical protein